jgi:hypothetical protein
VGSGRQHILGHNHGFAGGGLLAGFVFDPDLERDDPGVDAFDLRSRDAALALVSTAMRSS